MTVIIRYPTYAAPKSLGSLHFDPPVTEGLVGLYMPRKSAELSVKNWVPEGVNGSIGGAPDYHDFSATLSRFGWIETVHPETQSFTLIAIAEKVASGAALISTYSGSASTTPFGHLVFRNAAPQRIATLSKTSPVSGENDLGYDFPGDQNPEFFAGVCDAVVGEHRTYWPRVGSDIVGGNPRHDAFASGAVRNVSGNTWRVGATKIATTSTLYGAATKISLAMIYNRPLSSGEIAVNYEAALKYFPSREIFINGAA